MLPETDPQSLSFLSSTLPRLWILLCIVISLQISLFFLNHSLQVSLISYEYHFPTVPSPVNISIATQTTAAIIKEDQESNNTNICSDGKVYVYELPKMFNTELTEKCVELLNPWNLRCEAISNNGFGRRYSEAGGEVGSNVVPHNLKSSWYFTDQFASEIIYHNRILHHKCRTYDPSSASAYYIPYYAGLAVGKYLWSRRHNYSTSVHRDRHSLMLLKWVQEQVYFERSNGWDHFIMLGRFSGDFRRRTRDNNDWGSSFIRMPGMQNITSLLIERNPWDYFDIGVPYPTGFHPKSESELIQWQDFVSSRPRRTLFSFAGAKRGPAVQNGFRGILLDQCREASNRCKLVDCGENRCTRTSVVLETFSESEFCLQPNGGSFTRKSIFDCMIAGSIPVFFWHQTAYDKYKWFLPSEPESYSVFIDRREVIINGTSIRRVLEKFSKNEVRKMRDKVIEYIPKFVYADSVNGLGSTKDAFDVAIAGVLKRLKAQNMVG
ncbi:hypothetical protein MKX03_034993 [Papaver bracteatum]|nr:hypothetical protein MKX03_034993 [Papaver bracteatum]